MVARDASSYGRVMAAAFTEQARAIHFSVGNAPKSMALFEPAHPGAPIPCAPSLTVGDFLYYGGAKTPTGLVYPCTVAVRYRDGVMATDALMTPEALRVLRTRPDLRLTSAAEDPSQLPPEGQRFLREFRQRYDREPGRYAAYGYEGMTVVLDSIRRAGDSGDDRDAVVDAFFDTANRQSVLGTYSIDDVGNTTLDRLAGYRVVNGNARFETPLHVTP
jgi:ABC-type branched-subunit amino acid transport system substrate-binding protein